MAQFNLNELLTGARRLYVGMQGQKPDGTVANIKTNDQGEILTRLTGTLSDFKTDVKTVTATAVELTAGITGKKQLLVYPPDVGTVYWGPAGVTSANGAPLKAGDLPMEFSFTTDTVKVFAVSDGTNRTVRIVESK